MFKNGFARDRLCRKCTWFMSTRELRSVSNVINTRMMVYNLHLNSPLAYNNLKGEGDYESEFDVFTFCCSFN